MISLLLSDISNALNGQLQGEDLVVNSITIDSRTLQKGDLFLALKGDNFDGHKFIAQAEKLGCIALIVDHSINSVLPQIIVEDTHKALGQMGAYVKEQVSPKTVAITGSSGKTTVKEMVSAILSRIGNVLATNGNFNNDIGVPLTLLRLEKHHNFAVVELGANHMGEIAYTTELTQPDVAIINNIAEAHLEGFGDLCGVARAKGEIFEGLTDDGVAIYNQDCELSNKWQSRIVNKKVRLFSCISESDCYSTDVTLDENGCASFTLNSSVGNKKIRLTIPGQHNVCNAIAAASIAIEFGASLDDIRLGLAQMQPVNGRLNMHHLTPTLKVIDDTYNANVGSIKAATNLLSTYSGTRILILGDMGELGEEAKGYHQEVGQYAKERGIEHLLTVGELSQITSDAFYDANIKNNCHFSSKDELVKTLTMLIENLNKHNNDQPISILIKGSRSAHMEYVVKQVTSQYKSSHHEELV